MGRESKHYGCGCTVVRYYNQKTHVATDIVYPCRKHGTLRRET